MPPYYLQPPAYSITSTDNFEKTFICIGSYYICSQYNLYQLRFTIQIFSILKMSWNYECKIVVVIFKVTFSLNKKYNFINTMFYFMV